MTSVVRSIKRLLNAFEMKKAGMKSSGFLPFKNRVWIPKFFRPEICTYHEINTRISRGRTRNNSNPRLLSKIKVLIKRLKFLNFIVQIKGRNSQSRPALPKIDPREHKGITMHNVWKWPSSTHQ